MKLPLEFYFSLNGRISRKAIWLAVTIPFFILSFATQLFDDFLFHTPSVGFLGAEYGIGSFSMMLLLAGPFFATSIRRFHDLNWSGWWAVVQIPVYFWFPSVDQLELMQPLILYPLILLFAIGALLGLKQLFFPGTFGENRFGLDPREAKA